MKAIRRLHASIEAVAPIVGFSIGDVADKATWRVDFAANATDAQRAAAAGVIEAFDASAPEPREALGSDLLSVLTKTEHQALTALARADDLRIVTARGQDMIPETNSKIARLATAAGVSVATWFSRLP